MINLIGLAVLGVMIAEWFQPIQFVKNYLKLYNYKATSWLYCVKCVSFWLGLGVTLDLASAGVVCILGYIISYLIDLTDKHRYDN